MIIINSRQKTKDKKPKQKAKGRVLPGKNFICHKGTKTQSYTKVWLLKIYS